MDKLAEQLKMDAERIDVPVSEELDRRIEASLLAVSIERPKLPEQARRSAGFWWTSSLTGVAAALVVIAIVNSNSQTQLPPEKSRDTSPVTTLTTVPVIDWKTESAMLTGPLQQELEDLQSDIKKAEQKVRQDIGI